MSAINGIKKEEKTRWRLYKYLIRVSMRADDEFDDVDERKSQCNFAIIRREEVESLT